MGAPHFSFVCRWYDLWVGAYWSSSKRTLYILPVPCVGIAVEFGERAIAARVKAVIDAVRGQVVGDGVRDTDEVAEVVETCARRRGFSVEHCEVGLTADGLFTVFAVLRGWGDTCDFSMVIDTRPH